MSFGFGVGDFLAVLEIAQSVRAKWVDAPPEYASIKNEVKNVENVLRDIEELDTRIELNTRETQNLRDVASSCIPVLESCSQLVEKYAAITNSGSGSRNRIRRSWKRFKLDPDDIRHARDQLSSIVTQLTAIEGAIQLRMDSDIREVVDDLRESENQHEREQIADWYAPASFAVQRDEYSKLRQKGTGTWFLQDDRYLRWRGDQNVTSHSALLCPGIPGSGKTMMATAVIDDLCEYIGDEESCVVAYFYCNFNRREQQDLCQIYSSLIRQLSQGQRSIPEEVRSLYLKHRNKASRPSMDELEKLLFVLAQQQRKAYFIIDALDECNIENLTRDRLLRKLFDLQHGSGNIKFLATSRFIPEIMQEFAAYEQIEVRATKEDIERYLDNRMGELASFVRRRADLQQEIKSEVVTLVDGMFLLARLHFEALRGYTNATKLRKALHELPSGKDALSKAYDTARERIDHQPKPQADLARHVLTWIAYAKRELSIKELQEAIVISMTPDKKIIDPENDLDEPDEIVSVCAGLVTLDSETGTIRLVHYTTQSYIDSIQDQWLPNAQVDISRSCIAYFNLDALPIKRIQWRCNLKRYFYCCKLLRYVSYYWGVHVRETTNAKIQDLAIQLLCDDRRRCFVSQAMLLVKQQGPSTFVYPPVSRIAPLHVCAYFDLAVICGRLIATGVHCDDKDGQGRTPLMWAAREGSLDTVQLLLSQPHANVNAGFKDGCTALLEAARGGHEGTVELLLCQPDIEVNAKAQWGQTALSEAAGGRHYEVVELLLRHPSIDFNAKAADGATALIRAAWMGHEGIIKLLLRQPGIEVNAKARFGGTALCGAIDSGNYRVIELLLGHPGVDLNAEDETGRTALQKALWRGDHDIVTLLSQQPNIDSNTRDKRGKTLLMTAAESRKKTHIKFLLRQPGTDVNARDDTGSTALMYATRDETGAAARILLRQPNIHLNAKNGDGCTALIRAAHQGNTEMVKLLLRQRGIDVNTKDSDDETALTKAARGFEGAIGRMFDVKDIRSWMRTDDMYDQFVGQLPRPAHVDDNTTDGDHDSESGSEVSDDGNDSEGDSIFEMNTCISLACVFRKIVTLLLRQPGIEDSIEGGKNFKALSRMLKDHAGEASMSPQPLGDDAGNIN